MLDGNENLGLEFFGHPSAYGVRIVLAQGAPQTGIIIYCLVKGICADALREAYARPTKWPSIARRASDCPLAF